MPFPLEKWKSASLALVVSKNKECKVVDAEETKEGVIVTLKGFREDNPEKLTRILATVNGKDILIPITLSEEPSEEEEVDTFAEGVIEDVEENVELKPDEKQPAEEEEEKPEEDEDTGLTPEDEGLLQEWVTVGLPITDFVAGKPDKMRKIIKRTKTTPKEPKTNTGLFRMNKFIDKGTFIPIVDFLVENNLVNDDDDLDKATAELLDAFTPFIAGCKYSGEFRKVGNQLILKEVKAGITEMYRRIVSAYPGMVKWGLVEDSFNLKVKK